MTRRRPQRRQNRLQDSLHPPVNVRVVGVDGTEHAVQTVYQETDATGTQVFRVVDLPVDVTIKNVKMDLLPAATTVVFPTELQDSP